MVEQYIYFKSDRTGDAWWPVTHDHIITFEHNQVYRIFGQVYVANTGRFREVWEWAWEETMWDILSDKKGLY